MFRLIVHERVRAELQSLPAVVQAKMIHLLDKLRQDPLVLREPYSKPLRDGVFEVRTLGAIQSRGLYAFQRGRVIFLLRVFVKKSQKMPASEIALALKRLREMLNEQENH
ncbi:type II toxin-antitoxin system RelE/ParE family toxin [Yokenella regensburgei]|uniref:type II toxin-antitoxin system RelE/ParE family toxin n=1 Tax=Yokenella regensburgei TaxID=158877 RepID=UPI001375A5DB|nr:type II toxin-antitoxin system RelE/ParE family toxin [Yokenella regensburgei]KAF1370883.1 phage-related protein [Yokenella regensburgei]